MSRTGSRLAYFAITAALTVAGGCIPAASGTPDSVELSVSWVVKDLETGQVGCPADFPKMRVLAQVLFEDNSRDTTFFEVFDCAAGSGTMSLYQAGEVEGEGADGYPITDETTGRYQITLELTGEQGQVVRAASLPRYVDLRSGPGAVAMEVHPGADYFLAIWQLLSGAGEQITCEMAGVTDIELRYRVGGDEHAGDPLMVDRFPCPAHADGFFESQATGSAASRPLRLDDYVGVGVALANGTEVGQTEEFPFSLYPLAITRVPFEIPVSR